MRKCWEPAGKRPDRPCHNPILVGCLQSSSRCFLLSHITAFSQKLERHLGLANKLDITVREIISITKCEVPLVFYKHFYPLQLGATHCSIQVGHAVVILLFDRNTHTGVAPGGGS